jgi:hypothetical protein
VRVNAVETTKNPAMYIIYHCHSSELHLNSAMDSIILYPVINIYHRQFPCLFAFPCRIDASDDAQTHTTTGPAATHICWCPFLSSLAAAIVLAAGCYVPHHNRIAGHLKYRTCEPSPFAKLV